MTGYTPDPYETAVALRTFVGEVEALANGELEPPFLFGGNMTDGLDLVVRELFDAHPVTQLLVALSEEGA